MVTLKIISMYLWLLFVVTKLCLWQSLSVCDESVFLRKIKLTETVSCSQCYNVKGCKLLDNSLLSKIRKKEKKKSTIKRSFKLQPFVLPC